MDAGEEVGDGLLECLFVPAACLVEREADGLGNALQFVFVVDALEVHSEVITHLSY